ncbi:MAG TPA: hypothetical protein VK607_27465 [Kofleriaceae bacterium]|nr:hypothetical protein [Kofleriaceae bacterium]HMG52636.1 hypothetical protein [Kofleriaceae bacterium]
MKLVGERRALAAAIMAFYFLLYGVMAFAQLAPEFTKAFAAIAGVYGLAFFALVAGYFWARWFAVGVGLYGVITAAVGIWQIGAEPVLLFIGGTHLAATVFLWGQTMSEPYDGQHAWREKFHMDDGAVQRLGRSVIRAGVSLPFILLYAFVPRPDSAATALSLAAFVLAAVGLRGLVQLRTWGVLALGAAGALILAVVGADALGHGLGALAIRPTIAGGMLIAAIAPYLAPIARFVTAR